MGVEGFYQFGEAYFSPLRVLEVQKCDREDSCCLLATSYTLFALQCLSFATLLLPAVVGVGYFIAKSLREERIVQRGWQLLDDPTIDQLSKVNSVCSAADQLFQREKSNDAVNLLNQFNHGLATKDSLTEKDKVLARILIAKSYHSLDQLGKAIDLLNEAFQLVDEIPVLEYASTVYSAKLELVSSIANEFLVLREFDRAKAVLNKGNQLLDEWQAKELEFPQEESWRKTAKDHLESRWKQLNEQNPPDNESNEVVVLNM